jgi:hypothetical protein
VKATITLAPVTSPLSGRQRALSKLDATTDRVYKLSGQLGPLGYYAPSAPTLTSDHPPEPPNFVFPPKLFSTPS